MARFPFFCTRSLQPAANGLAFLDTACYHGIMNESTPKDELGRRLRIRRKAKGMTTADVAFAMGVSRSVISRSETGDRGVTYSDLKRFAAVLSCSVRDLVPPPKHR